MTFTRSIKEELSRLKLSKKENLAEFSALLALNGEIKKNKIIFSSKNIAIIRRFYALAKELYEPSLETITKDDKRIASKGYLVFVKSELDKIESEHKLEHRDLITQTNDEKGLI